MPWSPLARGRLTRPVEAQQNSERGGKDAYAEFLYRATEEADRRVIQAVTAVATARGVSQAQIASACCSPAKPWPRR